jgi:hypothetical protein
MRPDITKKRRNRLTLGVIVLGTTLMAISLVAATDGYSVWSTTERAPVVVDPSTYAQHPQSVSDGNGGVVVAWQRQYGGGIRVQRLDHTGTQQWIASGVVLSTTGFSPRITAHPGGGFVVAWYETEATKTGIYVQRVSAAGSPMWTAGGVQISTIADVPAVRATSTAGTFVGWITSSNDARIGNINDAGQPTAPGVNGISLGGNAATPFDLQLVTAGGGSVIAVWQDNSLNSRILAQKVGPGLPWGSIPHTVAVVTNRHNQIPVAAADGLGGAVVAWQCLPRAGGGIQYRTQRIDGNGTTQWTAGGIVLVDSDVVGGEYTSWLQNNNAAIASDGEGGAFIAWNDFRRTTLFPGDGDVYMQRIDFSGNVAWDANGITPAKQIVGSEWRPQLVTDGAGGVLVAFEEYFAVIQDNWEVMGARFDRLGNPHWRMAAYFDTMTDAVDQFEGQLVYDGSGPYPQGVIYVWLDDEDGDIYALKYEVSRPFGDICNADTPVLEPGVYELNLAGANAEMESECGGAGADLWFRFVAPSNGTLIATTCGTNDHPDVDEGVDTVLSLHADCPAGGNNYELTCNDDWSDDQCGGQDTGNARDSYVETPLVQGQSVLIRVSRYWASFNGEVLLNVLFEAAPPANDDCVDALPVTAGSLVGTMRGATTDGAASCAESLSDVWYVYTAPTSAMHYFFTCETNDMGGIDQGTDTVLSIHSACPVGGDMHELACNNDANGGCEGMDQGATLDSIIGRRVAAGESVWIRVARHASSFDSEFFLHIAAEAAAAGRVPSHEAEGEPLRVSKIGAEVLLTWGPSCMPSDFDYAVYAAPMALYGLHEPVTCTTMGLLHHQFLPPPDDTYFLVVPHNGVYEGSHGPQGGAVPVERPPSPATCYPQVIGECP